MLTTCARDYVTWRDDYPAGTEMVNGVPVRRFPVDHERDPHVFGRWSDRVFNHPHSYLDELKWLDAEGPKSTSLLRHLRSPNAGYDYVLFFSYRYYHAYHGAKALPSRAILVPTAERDEAIGLALSPRIFRGVRAIMYNSPEERRLIQAVSNNHDVPGVVVGIGSEIPVAPAAGTVPPEVRDYGALCSVCRAHRSEQGLQRAVFVLSERAARHCRKACSSS